MEKSIHSPQATALVALLRELREDAGLTQQEVAARVGEHQSFVSKYESGERRLDLIELAQVAEALGTTLIEFVTEYERRR